MPFFFDKMGTITHGQWKLLKTLPTGAITAREALAIAASLEQESEHDIAMELKNTAKQAGLSRAHSLLLKLPLLLFVKLSDLLQKRIEILDDPGMSR